MAKADQKVTSPQPIWIFLWTFGLITACFLAAHHWHYKIKNKAPVQDYAPQPKTTYVKPAPEVARNLKQYEPQLQGAPLADQPVSTGGSTLADTSF